MRMLSEILQAPDPVNMEAFFSRLPVVFNVVIFSVHGYFGQSDVLGLPDTGGQVHTCRTIFVQHVATNGISNMNLFFINQK